MIDQLAGVDSFNGLRYCHENFLQYFHPIYMMRDGFKKVSVMCDR